jgi:hypothetical protein
MPEGHEDEQTIANRVTAAGSGQQGVDLVAISGTGSRRRRAALRRGAWRPELVMREQLHDGVRHLSSPALLAANFETPMPILDATEAHDPVGAGGGTKK